MSIDFPYSYQNVTIERSVVRECIEEAFATVSPGFVMEYRENLLATVANNPKLAVGSYRIGSAKCPVALIGHEQSTGEFVTWTYAFDDVVRERLDSTGFKILTLTGR